MVQDANVKRMHTEKLLKEAESSVSLHSMMAIAVCPCYLIYPQLSDVNAVSVFCVDKV